MDNNIHAYKVSEITENIKSLLEHNFPKLWIEGEISNFSVSPAGHTYFTLKDEASQIKVVLFKSRRLLSQNRTQLKDGIQVYIKGKISVYKRSGNYQIIAEKWEPKGLGALQLAFEELKKKLHKEGLFDQEHKKSVPLLPQIVGVITSPTGAAIRDIINVLNRRFSNINILISPVPVQGKNAPAAIAKAITEMNSIPDIDTLIVGRGGGSLEDLWAFNEECVARSIFNSSIPVISAVGHEIDYTISDFVSDLRAPTPSAAAELVIGKKSEFTDKIKFLKHKLNVNINYTVQELRKRVDEARKSYVFKEPENTLNQYSQHLDELRHRLNIKTEHTFEIHAQRLNSLKNRVKGLNPKSILNRGYSITTNINSKIIVKSEKEIKNGDIIETRVAKGKFTSVVKS